MESAIKRVIEENRRSQTMDFTSKQPEILRESEIPDERISTVQADSKTEAHIKIKPRTKVDFSIEAILSSRATDKTKVAQSSDMYSEETKQRCIADSMEPHFSWVYCTRYRPPKLPRVKRDLGLRTRYRNPRIPFSTSEVNLLETKFMQSPYLGSNDVNELAEALNMSPKRVKIWFQNRRARERRERETQ